jgi:hypothetical protein
VTEGANVTVAITNPTGFTITPTSRTVAVHRAPTAVAWSALTANGAANTTDTTQLTLTFDVDPTSLAATDITVTGATKGTLSGTGTTRTLTISNITVTEGQNVTVAITNPTGFTITPASRTVAVHKAATAKAITDFTLAGQSGTINEGAGTIAVTVPYGTSITSIAPEITHTGASISPTAAQNFTNPVTYTVTAANGTTKAYTVTVTVALNSAKAITDFTFAGQTGIINEGAGTIAVTVPYGTSITSIAPVVTHTGASISPVNGVPQNFTSPVTYTVTAANGTTKDYTVTVTVALNSAKAITDFTLAGQSGEINEGAGTIAVTVPYGTVLTALTPTITHTGASINPVDGVPQNFTSPVTYTVTAANGTTKTYTVAVTVALNTAKAITDFTLAGQSGAINEGAGTIAVTVPYGTNITSIAPVVTHTGASINPVDGVPQNFTSPVTYTVTAANGTTKAYTVTVTVALNSAKAITDFTLAGQSGAINESAGTIAVTVPYGTSITSIAPEITHTGASINPVDGVPQNFTNPVTYTVTAANGTTKAYTVTVTVALNSAKAITDFTLAGQSGAINEGAGTIAVTVPHGTVLTALTPTITHTGASISPTTAQNFTSPVTYTVTAANGTTKTYTVTVTVALNSAKAITDFTLAGQTGIINEGAGTIAVTVPYGTDITSIAPVVTHTGASINPVDGVPQNFTSPVTYTVTAANGTTKAYTVTVTVALNSAKAITDFTLAGQSGAINEGAGTIAATVPYGMDITSIAPVVTHTGASINPVDGVPQNFTSPVTYTVTAANGTTKTYTVTVTVAPPAFVAVTGITGVPTTATVGTPITLSGTVAPNNATNQTIVWSGTGVSGNQFTPASAGTATITATITNGLSASSDYTQNFNITVSAAPPAFVPVTNITGVPTTATVGTPITLSGTALPSNATNKTIVWSGTGVSGNQFTPTSAGTATITATITNGLTASSDYTQNFNITVSAAGNGGGNGGNGGNNNTGGSDTTTGGGNTGGRNTGGTTGNTEGTTGNTGGSGGDGTKTEIDEPAVPEDNAPIVDPSGKEIETPYIYTPEDIAGGKATDIPADQSFFVAAPEGSLSWDKSQLDGNYDAAARGYIFTPLAGAGSTVEITYTDADGNETILSFTITDAATPLGDGAKDKTSGFPWWIIAIVVVVIAALLWWIITRKRRKGNDEQAA